jgi:3-oxoacyl-[acyl-carrier-protein] synthase-1
MSRDAAMSRRSSAEAEILAVGMVTPVGASARQTAASVRAGIGRLAESYATDRTGAPLVMGLCDQTQLPPLTEEVTDRRLSVRHDRMLRMAGPALAEALGGPAAAGGVQPPPLLLGLTEPRAGARAAVGPEMLELVAAQSGQAIDRAQSRIYPLGRAAGLLALDDALALLDRREAAAVVVGAVDSYLDLGLLEALEGEGRLKTAQASDAFIAGEAAAFAVVAAAGTAARRGQAPLARVVATARGHEPGHLYSAEPHRGEGLSAALDALFAAPAGAAAGRVARVLGGLNGETFWAKEWGVARIRHAARFAETARLEHPADTFGDAGAALGPAMLALAALDLARGGDGPCLVWCGSDRGERAAALLAAA